MLVAAAAVSFVCPFLLTPDWGAMTKPEQWNRPYSEYTQSEMVAIPKYDLKVLTTPMSSLQQSRTPENNKKITAKLFYSTRYCGSYDLDAGENVKDSKHCAVDLKEPKGTPVRAVAAGKVIEASTNKVLGLHVTIQHADGYVSTYGHFDSVVVRKGRRVRAGAKLGVVGLTGYTAGYHTHLEMWKDGVHVNPMSLLPYPCK